jgi:hypothetical protein
LATDRCSNDKLGQRLMNKSEEMRRLARQGLAVGDIAQRLGVRYQFAYNVLKASGLLAPTRSNLLPRAGAFGEGRSEGSPARSPPSADSPAVQEAAWDTFIGVLREYVEERLPLLPQTYNWDIPTYAEMVLDGANDAERSISLRNQLSATWAVADAAERRRIAIFYVTGFGGIRSNACGSACNRNRDPLGGVIGVEEGPLIPMD